MIIGIVVTVALIAAFGLGVHLIDNVLGDDEKTSSGGEYEGSEPNQVLYFGDYEYEVTHNIESYLLIGTDDSGNQDAEGTDEYRGQMADFLLLYVMDKTDNTYGFLQINRDTMVDVPEMDTEGNGEGENFEQICTAHWYGGNPEHGCNNTIYCVSTLLGDLAIDGYYSVHMSDVRKLNHAVGGVEVTLDEDFSGSDPEMTKGKTLTLTDEQAEIFVRGRMTIGDGENTSRMERQTQFMESFKKKAGEKIKEDSGFINDLFADLEEDAVTNIPGGSVSSLVNHMYKSEDLGILTYNGETKVGDTMDDGVDHTEFYADEDSIAQAMVKLLGIDNEHIIPIDDGEDE